MTHGVETVDVYVDISLAVVRSTVSWRSNTGRGHRRNAIGEELNGLSRAEGMQTFLID